MELRLPTPADFSFYETTHSHGWRHLLPFSWHEETASLGRILRFPDGSVARVTIRDDAGAVVVTAEPDGNSEEIAEQARHMLQMDRDLSRFHQFCRARPELAHIPLARKGRMLRSPTLYEDVVKVILTTNTTWAQTKAMNARLVAEFGDPLPGSGEQAFPAPEGIAATPLAEFSERVRLGYRAQAVHELSVKVASDALDLEAWEAAALEAEELRRRLLGLRGVGPYAAACLMLYLGRPARVNVDSWARTLLSRELGRPVADRDVHGHFAQYGEWQGLVYSFYDWTHERRAASADIAA